MLGQRSPAGLEVCQLTGEPDVPSCHVYMEAQVFTPDSRRLVLHRWSHPHGAARRDEQHRYLLCDLDNDADLVPLTEEAGAPAPAVSPDGRYVYYFVDETSLNGGRLTLKRVAADGGPRETILVLDRPPDGADAQPSRLYSLSTISSDGRRIAISGFLGDGHGQRPPWGVVVFDIERAAAWVPLAGPCMHNTHLQYCRSTRPGAVHDIMIQEDHDSVHAADGSLIRGTSWGPEDGLGMDIHVVCDDGTDLRDLPWGRDGHEYCSGHQCWRGSGRAGMATVWTAHPKRGELREGLPAPAAGHRGAATPGARRNDLSRDFPDPYFCHFAVDAAARRLITDHRWDAERGCDLYLARLGEPLEDPLCDWQYLLDTRTAFGKNGHPHPFLSPDGNLAFFNSNESGINQAYMISGLP